MDELEILRETVKRLNRRCQKAESKAAKWKRRYAAILKPASNALERGMYYADRMRKWWRDAKRERRVLMLECENRLVNVHAWESESIPEAIERNKARRLLIEWMANQDKQEKS